MYAAKQFEQFKQFFEPVISVAVWLWSVTASLLIIGAFVGILYFTGARETWLWLHAKTWFQTQCVIEQVYSGRQEQTEIGSTSVKISFQVSARYRYRTDEGAFIGRRYDFKGLFPSSYQSVKKDLRYLRSNSTVPCYYNPSRPEQSVINRGFQTDFLFMLIPLLSLGLFAYLAFRTLLEKLSFGKLFQTKPKRFLP